MSFTGSGHCGAVKFNVDAQPPLKAISCNCSHCRRKGFLLSFFPAGQFTLIQGGESLRSYKFNTHKINHRFCERSEEHTSELQSLMRNSYAVFCLKKKTQKQNNDYTN